MEKLFSAIVRSHIWIGIAALSSYYYTCQVIFELHFEVNTGLFMLCSTTALYNLLGLLKGRKENFSLVVMILSTIGAGITALLAFSFLDLVWLLPAVIVGLFYGKNRWISIPTNWRNIPYLKIYLIAAVWVYITTIFPILISSESSISSNLLVILSQLFFLVAVTIPFDIRDLRYDSPHLNTIPQLLGVTYGIILSSVLIAISGGLIFVHGVQSHSSDSFIITTVTSLISIAVINKTSENRKPLFFTGLIDGLLTLQALSFIGFSALYVLKEFMRRF